MTQATAKVLSTAANHRVGGELDIHGGDLRYRLTMASGMTVQGEQNILGEVTRPGLVDHSCTSGGQSDADLNRRPGPSPAGT
jgi:hypothetical protein